MEFELEGFSLCQGTVSDEVGKRAWPESKGVYINRGTSVACKGNCQPMLECTHEEADTRVVVHINALPHKWQQKSA